jgi:hypothetical protein
MVLLLAAPQLWAQKSQQAEAERLRQEVQRLENLVALASSGWFYYLFVPKDSVLRLMLRGAILREYPVLDASLGRRKVLFVGGGGADAWSESVWERGRLRPARDLDRIEIVPPEDTLAADTMPVAIPPTPEEAIPAPGRFRIRYKEHRALEIVARDTAAHPGLLARAGGSLWAGLRGALAALWPWGDNVRLRLVLPSDQAGSLYRSVPDSTRFYVVREP